MSMCIRESAAQLGGAEAFIETMLEGPIGTYID